MAGTAGQDPDDFSALRPRNSAMSVLEKCAQWRKAVQLFGEDRVPCAWCLQNGIFGSKIGDSFENHLGYWRER